MLSVVVFEVSVVEDCDVTVVGATVDVSLDEVDTVPTVVCSVDVLDEAFNICMEDAGAFVTVVCEVAEASATVEESLVDEIVTGVDSDTDDVLATVEVPV